VWHEGLKAGWVKEIFDAQSEICERIAAIKIPFITAHGTADTLVDISSSQFLFDNASSEDKTFEVSVLKLCCSLAVYIRTLIDAILYPENVCMHMTAYDTL